MSDKRVKLGYEIITQSIEEKDYFLVSIEGQVYRLPASFIPVDPLTWKPDYISGEEVPKNTMVNDSGWARISNQVTSDPAAPQATGDPVDNISGAELWQTDSHLGVVDYRATFTFNQSGWVENLAVRAINVTLDTIYRVSVYNPSTGEGVVISNVLLKDNEWVIVLAKPYIVQQGSVLMISFEQYNAGTGTTTKSQWELEEDTGLPPTGVVYVNDVDNPTEITISITDSNGTSQSGIFSALDCYVHINEGDANRSFTVLVTNVVNNGGGSATYTCTPTGEGSNGPARNDRDVDVEISPRPTIPTDYESAAGIYVGDFPSFATVETALLFDNVDQGKNVVDAYPIRVTFQPAYVSTSWNTLASPGSGASGSSQVPVGSFSPVYEFQKESNITGFTTEYSNIVRLDVIVEANGTYEIKYAWSFMYSATNRQAKFRLGVSGDYFDFAKEPKDDDDVVPMYYAYPKIYNPGSSPIALTITLEGALTAGGDLMTIAFADIMFERVL